MKNIISKLLFLLLIYANGNSQEHYNKLPGIKSGRPNIIVNSTIISNEDFVTKNKNLIKDVRVMKDKPDKSNHKFYNLGKNGIVFIEINEEIEAKTLTELNNFFGLDKQNEVYLNGYLIDNDEYKIATESIFMIELVLPDSKNKLKSKSINIWTFNKDKSLNN